MDRDIALQITQKLTAINTALQGIVTGTTPTDDNRSVPAENMRSAPAEDQRSAPDPEEEPEEIEKK